MLRAHPGGASSRPEVDGGPRRAPLWALDVFSFLRSSHCIVLISASDSRPFYPQLCVWRPPPSSTRRHVPHFLNSVAPPLPHQDPFSRSPLPCFVAGQTRPLASSSCRAVVCPCRWSVGEVGLGWGAQCQGASRPDGPSLWTCQEARGGGGGRGAEGTDRSTLNGRKTHVCPGVYRVVNASCARALPGPGE